MLYTIDSSHVFFCSFTLFPLSLLSFSCVFGIFYLHLENENRGVLAWVVKGWMPPLLWFNHSHVYQLIWVGHPCSMQCMERVRPFGMGITISITLCKEITNLPNRKLSDISALFAVRCFSIAVSQSEWDWGSLPKTQVLKLSLWVQTVSAFSLKMPS